MFCRTAIAGQLILATLVSTVLAADGTVDARLDNDSDLTNFVTRPDIKSPLFNVTIHHPEAVVPGYWFIGPYAKILQEPHPKQYHQSCQTGPAIYDGNGELVWTGACRFRNQNACDVRAWQSNGSDYLSMILFVWNDVHDFKGRGIILNDTYGISQEVHVPVTMPAFNMHEFNVIDDGKRVLYITRRTQVVGVKEHGLQLGKLEAAMIADLGFVEVDLSSGKVLFEWWALDHVSLTQSTVRKESLAGPWPNGWNWIHLNSVDKNSDGDYMVSARYTNAIYKISGKDGSVLWTLGGINSSFTLQDFNFSRQHDARFLEQSGTTETITFLDNAADEQSQISNISSSLVVTLDKATMQAAVANRWVRPGDRLSKLRGNFQLLPNRNAFSAWSDNSHISEHSWDGKLLMEAEFKSTRFVTYRAWKHNFTGAPVGPPDFEVFVYGTSPAKSTTVYYVSWNGATEVAWWNFYRVRDGEESLIGSQNKTGFETRFQSDGRELSAFAEAVDARGNVLGRSLPKSPVEPREWSTLGNTATNQSVDAGKAPNDNIDAGSQAGLQVIEYEPLKTEL